jgi:hypothetical protein
MPQRPAAVGCNRWLGSFRLLNVGAGNFNEGANRTPTRDGSPFYLGRRVAKRRLPDTDLMPPPLRQAGTNDSQVAIDGTRADARRQPKEVLPFENLSNRSQSFGWQAPANLPI